MIVAAMFGLHERRDFGAGTVYILGLLIRPQMYRPKHHQELSRKGVYSSQPEGKSPIATQLAEIQTRSLVHWSERNCLVAVELQVYPQNKPVPCKSDRRQLEAE
jgi:hypothetical protein